MYLSTTQHGDAYIVVEPLDYAKQDHEQSLLLRINHYVLNNQRLRREKEYELICGQTFENRDFLILFFHYTRSNTKFAHYAIIIFIYINQHKFHESIMHIMSLFINNSQCTNRHRQ